MAKPVSVKQFKMGPLRNLITRPGDKEVVGEMVPWKRGTNPLADALDKAIKNAKAR